MASSMRSIIAAFSASWAITRSNRFSVLIDDAGGCDSAVLTGPVINYEAADISPLGQPNGSFGTAAFGSITTALDPRVFELAMKVHF